MLYASLEPFIQQISARCESSRPSNFSFIVDIIRRASHQESRSLPQPSTRALPPQRCVVFQRRRSEPRWVDPLSQASPLYTPRGCSWTRRHTGSGYFQLYFLDTTCSTFPPFSRGVGTGTAWDTRCVCSPGGRRYKCTGCIPGPSPKPGARRLRASTSCRCINKLFVVSSAGRSSRWSPTPL